MRRRFLAALALPALVVAVVLVLPLAALLLLVLADPARVTALTAAEVTAGARWGLLWLTLAALAGALTAHLGAAATTARLTRHVDWLRTRIGGIGEGGRGGPAPASGVAEVDELARAITARDLDLSRRMATERDFTSDAAHQLRTPLTALLMRLEELAILDDLDAVHEEAQVAIAQVVRLSSVVDDLRARTRSDAGELPTISLDSVLAATQREYQPAFQAVHRSMRIAGARGLMVRARPSDLAQIAGTLVENALEHGEGTVSVGARRSGPTVVLEVRDEGSGIPMAIAPHIFERAVTSQGTGLGLALARDLAERNGGRLQLVQAQPAVFELFLGDGRISR